MYGSTTFADDCHLTFIVGDKCRDTSYVVIFILKLCVMVVQWEDNIVVNT